MGSVIRVAMIISVAFAGTRAAATPCSYAAYTPGVMYRFLQTTLPQYGVALLPGIRAEAGPNTPDRMLRNSRLLGTVAYQESVRYGKETLRVVDPSGDALAVMTEQTGPCGGLEPRGICRETVFQPERGVVEGEDPPFRIVDTPRGVEYERYGRSVSGYSWRQDFRQAVEWLMSSIDTLDPGEPIAVDSPAAKVSLAIASDPFVAPYLSTVNIRWTGRRLVVTGVVPSNAVYGGIAQAAIAAGYPNVKMDVTIDTGLVVFGDDVPYLRRCWF